MVSKETGEQWLMSMTVAAGHNDLVKIFWRLKFLSCYQFLNSRGRKCTLYGALTD